MLEKDIAATPDSLALHGNGDSTSNRTNPDGNGIERNGLGTGVRQVVVVLGMHRSGTSLCMQILNELGIQIDDDLLPADAHNVKGYFESSEIVDLNDQILASLGVDWHTLFSASLNDHWFQNPALAGLQRQLAALISDKARKFSGIWGIKDPRLCVLLPMYDRAFAECGLEPLYVVCIRDPRSVSLSLNRRDGFPRLHTELLWVDNTIRAIQSAGSRVRAVVQYEKWFSDPGLQLDSLISGLPLRKNAENRLNGRDLATIVVQQMDHCSGDLGPFALTSTESIYRLLQNGDYDAAIREFAEIQQALRWGFAPGKNSSRVYWRPQQGAFVRSNSSSVLTDVDAARRVVRLPVPAGKLQLRLDPVSQGGLGQLFAIRLLSPGGALLWEWDGQIATLEAWESSRLTLVTRGGDRSVIVHFHDGTAGLVLPAGVTNDLPLEGGILEYEFAWLAMGASGGLKYVDAIAREFRTWNDEVTALAGQSSALAAQSKSHQEQLAALRAENAQRLAESEQARNLRQSMLRSWSWRLTAPVRFLGSWFLR